MTKVRFFVEIIKEPPGILIKKLESQALNSTRTTIAFIHF